MLDRTVTDPSGVTWSVGIRTRPRWRALSRRFGAWRRRNDPPDVDFEPVSLDLGSGPLPVRAGGGGGSWPEPSLGDASPDVDGGGWLDGWLDDLLIGIVVLVVLTLTVLVAWWVIVPLLLVVLDALVVAVLFVLGFLARIAIGRPWVVRARERVADGRWYEVDVKGWRNARDLQADWEAALTRGQLSVQPGPSASR